MDCIYYVGPTTLYRLKNQKGHIRIIEYQEFRDEAARPCIVWKKTEKFAAIFKSI